MTKVTIYVSQAQTPAQYRVKKKWYEKVLNVVDNVIDFLFWVMLVDWLTDDCDC